MMKRTSRQLSLIVWDTVKKKWKGGRDILYTLCMLKWTFAYTFNCNIWRNLLHLVWSLRTNSVSYMHFPLLFCSVCIQEDTAIPLSEIIPNHATAVLNNSDDVSLICVRRNHIWSDSISQFSKPSFDPTKSIRVIFNGEEGVGGGPRMEYFWLLCIAIRDESGLLFSKGRMVNFTNSVVHYIQRWFYLVGVIIATSILHGEAAFPFFQRVLFDYFASGHMSMACTVNDVVNPDIEAIIEEV